MSLPSTPKDNDAAAHQNEEIPLQGYPSAPPAPAPVVNQPIRGDHNATVWTNIPLPLPTCSQGLESLVSIGEILIHEKSTLEDCGDKKIFEIKNSNSQHMYLAVDNVDICLSFCWGTLRTFDIRLSNAFGNEVVRMVTSARTISFHFLLRTEVFTSSGTLLGAVQEQQRSHPTYTIKNFNNVDVLKLVAYNNCPCSCFKNATFTILSADGKTELGVITKEWLGLLRTITTEQNHYNIKFPVNLDVNIKMVIVAACFLINHIHF